MRSTRTVALVILVSLFSIMGRVVAADLSSCATDYGNLMVEHWLTVSNLHQAERLLYDHGELDTRTTPAIRFETQKKNVDETERRLGEAYREYAVLFKSQSKEGAENLSKSLKTISEAVS